MRGGGGEGGEGGAWWDGVREGEVEGGVREAEAGAGAGGGHR